MIAMRNPPSKQLPTVVAIPYTWLCDGGVGIGTLD